MNLLPFLIAVALIGGSIYYFTVLRKKNLDTKAKREKAEALQQQQAASNAKKQKTAKPTVQASTKTIEVSSSHHKKKDQGHSKSHQIEHKLFNGSVKGFAGEITDYDYNSEYLVVASKDKHVRIFRISDLSAGQIYYFSVEFGYATAIGISSDSRYVAYGVNVDKSIEIRTLDLSNSDIKKRSSPPKVFQKDCHKEEIQKIAFDINSKFIISSASKTDTMVKIWSLFGKQLNQINTGHNEHYQVRWSQTRKFYLIASWTSNLKALTFETDKATHEFKMIVKAYGLSHGASISYVNIDNLDQKAITISKKEKCIKFWDVNVKYEISQDPRLLKQFKGEQEQSFLFNGEQRVAISAAIHQTQDKTFYAASDGLNIGILNEKFEVIEQISNAVPAEFEINKLDFIQHGDSSLVLLSSSFNEGRINIFNLSSLL